MSGVYSRCRSIGSLTCRGDEVWRRGTASAGCRERWRSRLCRTLKPSWTSSPAGDDYAAAVEQWRWPAWTSSAPGESDRHSTNTHSLNIHTEQKQEAQLSQRDRATLRITEYFAKSLKLSHGNSKWHCRVGRVQVPITITLKLCLYLVPFLRYLAFKNGVTLKPGVGIVQDHWKWRPSIDRPYTTFYWSAIVSTTLCCTIFELCDVK